MKIAIFTDTFLPHVNGVVSSIANQINGLSERKHEIILFTAGKENKIYDYQKNVRVIQYKGLTLPSYKDYQIVVPKIDRTIKILKEFKPDIVHVQTPFGIGWIGILSGKKLKVPIVGTHHTFYSDYVKHIFKADYGFLGKINDKYTAMFFNKCDIVTSPSKALLDELKSVGVKREIVKIPNGIILSNLKKKKDLKKKYGLKKSVMYFGRVSYEKSIDIIIKAMKIVEKKHSDAILLIIGDGPNLNELKGLANKLGVKAVFTGFKKGQELVDSIYAGDIFVSASKSENQPMSILEAMACSKAMVGVDAKGVPELIINNKNGLIAEPDNINDIAEKINKLLEDTPLRKRFEKASLKLVKSYSIKETTKKWEEVYKKIIRNNHS